MNADLNVAASDRSSRQCNYHQLRAKDAAQLAAFTRDWVTIQAECTGHYALVPLSDTPHATFFGLKGRFCQPRPKGLVRAKDAAQLAAFTRDWVTIQPNA